MASQPSINDHNRTRFHYQPPANWMNDPNGVIQWGDRYHLFFQYNPYGPTHANMHWGHAISDDLIHWQHAPVALAPTAGSADEGGIFSGCIVNHNGTPTAFYTGVNADYSVQTQCMATGSADLVSWEKYPGNPLIAAPPAAMGQTHDFRDPFVWQQDGTWYMLVATRMVGVGGAGLLYRSSDLQDWEYLNPLLVGDSIRSSIVWECPNFFPLGDKWVLIISSHTGLATASTLYFVGQYENHRFIPEIDGVLDGGYYYAPLTFLDNQGRRIMYGWLREGRSVPAQVAAGWSGVQAIPRVLSLDSHNRLITQPVPELSSIRGGHYRFDSARHGTDHAGPLDLPVKGQALEIRATFAPGPNTTCGLAVACAPDGSEQARILYDTNTQVLSVERQYAAPSDTRDGTRQGIPHRLAAGESLDLTILLDGSVLEIIANGRTSLTSRFYPESAESQHVRLINPAATSTLDIWEMASIWP